MLLFASQQTNIFTEGPAQGPQGGGEVAFHEDAVFPEDISYGSSGGPGHRTTIQEGDAGNERRVRRWSQPRLAYNVAERVKTRDQMVELLQFYRARAGSTYGFRFEDWLDRSSAVDHRTDPTDPSIVDTASSWQVLGDGDGTTTTFQLVKHYVDGSVTRERPITKPQPGTVKLYSNGVPIASGWTIDNTTGIVTFASAPVVGQTISAAFMFHVPVRFGEEIDEQFNASIDAFDTLALSSVPLVEIKDELEWPEEKQPGGMVEEGLASNRAIGAFEGFYFRFEPFNGGVKIFLPDPTTYSSGGGPIMMIENVSSVNSMTVYYSDQVTLATGILSGSSVELWLVVDDSTGTFAWVVR